MFLSVIGDVNHDGVPGRGSPTSPTPRRDWRPVVFYVHSGADGRRLLTLTGETVGEGFGIGTRDGRRRGR